MSDFGALSVGPSRLQAHRPALDIPGHNLANVNREPNDSSLASQVNRFMAAWDDVANRPDDLSARQQLIEVGKTLAADFRLLDNSIAALSQNTGRELTGQPRRRDDDHDRHSARL